MRSCVLVTRMATRQSAGTTPFDRLRDRLDRVARRCPACGYEDRDGHWKADTSGGRVRYSHRCPSCNALDTVELSL
jgi:Zn ribbon nucleic-acid-binding protein